jgi:N-acetylmuramoyl-L-alanine amidase
MSLAVFKPAWPEEIQQARREPQPSKCDRSQFRVILDVGHTAEALGAISARNVPEYYFNYRLAAQIERSLIEDGFDKIVLLVTRGPARPSLFDRVARANRLSANLFVPCRTSYSRAGNSRVRKAISATDSGATRFSSRTKIRIATEACCSAACSGRN